MIIQVSEKHAEGEYGKPINDNNIPKGEIFRYIPYPEFLTVTNGKYVAYIKQDWMDSYPDGIAISHALKKNTVITFTQDKLS